MPQTLSCKSQTLITKLTSKYNELSKFLVALNPSMQISVVSDETKCFTGEYPSFSLLDDVYGHNASAQWIVPQLENISEFCGCKGKLTKEQLAELSIMVSRKYWYLKVSEFMYFCYRFKSGHYGQFYGSVDPMKIMDSLIKFDKERGDKLSKFEESKRITEERLRPEGMTYKEYCMKYKGMTSEQADEYINKNASKSIVKNVDDEDNVKYLAKVYCDSKSTMSQETYNEVCSKFKAKYGVLPEEYLSKN